MKIVMLRLGNSNLIHDSRVIREAEALVRHGYEVTVSDISKSGQDESFVYECSIQIDLLHLHLKRYRIPGPIKYLEYMARTLRFLLQSDFDVVHVHDLDPLPVAWIYGRLRGAKVVYDSHELYTEQDGFGGVKQQIYGAIERFLLKRVNAVIAANESRARIMRDEYGCPQLPTVILNIPETRKPVKCNHLRRFIEQQRGAPLSKADKIVLYQGGLSAARGLENIVRAFSELPGWYYFVLMGYGPLKEPLRRLINKCGLSDRVFIHPAVPYKDLHEYSCSADLGVISYLNTSRNKYYCAPNKLFEYAMAGIPMVGSDLPEIRRIIERYKVGSLFDPENPASIAGAIQTCLSTKERYIEMKLGLEQVVNDYRWDFEAAKLLSLYRVLEKV